MMRTVYFVIGLLIFQNTSGQEIKMKIKAAMDKLNNDPQLKHAITSLYITDIAGNVIFDQNGETGMAPASTLKVITSATAFALLGPSYTYKTYLGIDGQMSGNILKGNFFIDGGGDPTLGSWRWESTKREKVFNLIMSALNKNKISGISGGIFINDLNFDYQPVPDGWIWQDMGNYYGAGAWGVNWHENKYAINFKPGSETGAKTELLSTEPVDLTADITNLVTTGEKGTGDRGIIYSAPYSKEIFVSGTVPRGEKKFTIHGSIPFPPAALGNDIGRLFKQKGISYNNIVTTYSSTIKTKTDVPRSTIILDSIISPSLDSINRAFMKESINLYGEAFVKAISYVNNSGGNTDSGISLIRKFWNKNGIVLPSLKIIDGSGLSPQNRVSTISMVKILQFAKTQTWYPLFYSGIPEMNGIKMKSGYINGVRAYSGVVKSKNGNEYTFAFIINNFDGSAGSVREKMWKVLDVLK